MKELLDIAVVGAGLIGRKHIARIDDADGFALAAIVDPDAQAARLASKQQTAYYPGIGELFENQRPDGVILATPTDMHIEQASACVRAACPVLIEKPIATDSGAAADLVTEAKRHKVPILVGHHRRYNPLVVEAERLIRKGLLGDIRAVHLQCWFYKPGDYFEAAPWRKRQGAGPVSVNLIHDIDLVRFLCGEILSVQALMTPSARGYENEESAVALLSFANGALGTVTLSDTIAAPWSWEMTAGENPDFPETTQSCYLIGGTEASLSLPDLKLWKHEPPRSWLSPIAAQSIVLERLDPLQGQLDHFGAVIRAEAEPLVSGEEAIRSLRVIEAISDSAREGRTVKLEEY